MITVPAIFESFRSLKDRTYKLIFETSELTPAQLSELGSNLQQAGYLAFNNEVFTSDKLNELSQIKCEFDDVGKSKAQRLRAVLYVMFEQDSKGYEVFDDYYNHKMEKIINHFKNQLQ
jgi:hypothetical protein